MHHGESYRDGSVALGALKGAVAGAIGTWVMGKVTTFLYERHSEQTLQEEKRARPEGKSSATLMAERASRAVGVRLDDNESSRAATGIHYGLGIVPAAIYGALLRDSVGGGLTGGLLLGLGAFLALDEGMNWAAGTAGPPGTYPWEAHARGLAGHVAYGLATEAALAVLDRA